MKMNTSGGTPMRTWAQVVALLVEAARRGDDEDLDPYTRSVTLSAELVAFQAGELLPEDIDPLGEGMLDARAGAWSVAQLIRAAEQHARLHPIEQFPVGASGVIVALGDLVHLAHA